MTSLVLTRNGVERREADAPKPRIKLVEREQVRPQKGPQELFLSSPADIAIYGGAAGGGKSYGLLMEPLRHIHRPTFGAVIFRRTYPEIMEEGGLWDTSIELYSKLGAIMRENDTEWRFRTQGGGRSTISFSHLQHTKNMLDWQGAQVPLFGFDELTHFEEQVFFYLFSRLRTSCGIEPYVRATCNPDPDSWVANFIAWWIDQHTGFPIIERSGVLRWFIREKGEIIWADSKEELLPQCGKDVEPLSVTFISATVDDNQIMLSKNPRYKSKLSALSYVDMMRLLKGNWKIRRMQGDYFRRAWFGEPVEQKDVPQLVKLLRYWDRASTMPKPENPNPDWTVGVLMGRSALGIHYVVDVCRFRGTPGAVEQKIREVGQAEPGVPQILEQDPGQAGASEVFHLARSLQGIPIMSQKVSTNKAKRALPASTACEHGLLKIVRGAWNEAYLDEMESFCDEDDLPPGVTPPKDDQVDGTSGAYNKLQAANPRLRFI